MRLNFLLNWRLNPYHLPIVVAQKQGFYKNYDIDLSILQPTNPSDVTKIIGNNELSIGLKAMVHCYAARARGYKIKSIGTLLDEPPTGLISRKKSNINNIRDIIGKRIGYVGEFGKVMIDNLAKENNVAFDQYQTVKVGMDGSGAIINDIVDATIGIGCFQQLELQYAGYEANMLRIDEAANLGCCCFCSVLYIANETLIYKEPKLIQSFMQASYEGAKFTREQPDKALECFFEQNQSLNNELNKNIFYHALPFISSNLLNVERDWQKVCNYAKRLKIIDQDYNYKDCYTNSFAPIANATICAA